MGSFRNGRILVMNNFNKKPHNKIIVGFLLILMYITNGKDFGKCTEVQRTDIFIEKYQKMYLAPTERHQ